MRNLKRVLSLTLASVMLLGMMVVGADAKGIFSNGKAAIKFTTEDGESHSYVANSNTVFLIADPDKKDFKDWVFSVYTGVMNAPDIEVRAADPNKPAGANDVKISVATAPKSNVARVVYVENADISGNANVTFIVANANANVTYWLS